MVRCRATLLAVALLVGAGAADAAPKAPTLKVEIVGVEDELLDNVRAYLSVERYREDPTLDDVMVERLHARAVDEVRASLRPFGYYRPEVDAALEPTAKGWIARYTIVPGEPVRIVTLDVVLEGEGRDDPTLRAALADAPLRVGGVARHDRYERYKDRIQAAAEDNGYLDARFVESQLEIDPGAGQARVRLRLETGPKLLFGEIVFQQDVVDDGLVARYASFKPGDAFSVRKLLDLQYALNDSDYFRLVEIEPQRDKVGEDRRVPVVVRLTPRERTRWTFGLGYATDTGPRGSIGYEDRRVNRSGHRASVELEDSEIKTELRFTYTIPLANPATERLALRSLINEEQNGDTQSRRRELGASLIKTFGRYRQTIYSDYQYERSEQFATPVQTSNLLIPGYTLSYTKADAPLYVREGHRWSVDVHGAHDALLSDASFLQARVEGKLVHSFGGNRLIARAEYAQSFVAEASELPSSQRLFAGGDQSVRGYGYQSIGPTDVVGNVIGGTKLFTSSVEVDRLLYKKWGAAVFVDAGDAVEDTPLAPKVGAGLGLRWVSPIGMLRVDVGWPLEPGEDGWHLHFSIGPDL